MWIEVFGRLHPLLLHLPIGLLVGLALFEGLAAMRRGDSAPRTLVVLAGLTAALAAASGWVLHREPDYGGPTLELHQWLGISTATFAFVAMVLRLANRRSGYRTTLALAFVALLFASHFGAAITHGAGFVLEPLRRAQEAARESTRRPALPSGPESPSASNGAPNPEPNAPSAGEGEGGVASSAPDAPDTPALATYTADVAHVLATYCISCHGESKQKSGLRLDAPEHILAGSRDEPVLAPGDVAASPLVQRITLPLDDPDHMPPDNKPQPSRAEVALIEAWVAAGAPFDKAFEVTVLEAESAPEPEPARVAVTEPAESSGSPPPAPEPALEALRAHLVHVEPVARGSNALWVDLSAAASALSEREIVALLEPLREQIAELSLARSAITDPALEGIARMPRLRRLDLSNTEVTSAGLAALAGHPALAEFVLVDTRLDGGAVETLLDLPALRRAWLWKSGIGAEGIARLRAERPALEIDAGDATESSALETEGELSFSGDAPPPGAEPSAPTPAADAGALRPTNATCPVSGSPVDPRYAVVFEGRVVGFCCPNCPARFWAEPDRYRAALH